MKSKGRLFCYLFFLSGFFAILGAMITLNLLSVPQQVTLFFIAFCCVAFGQPAWIWWLGPVAAVVGYALFWRVLLCYQRPLLRFCLGLAFGTGVQLVQLSWFLSHPYWYIYVVHVALSLSAGVQFGILSLLITRRSMEKISDLLVIASLWTVMEWMRLFFMAGIAFNTAGMALAGNLYSLQTASIWGAFGMTFWVMLVNLVALYVWCRGITLGRLSALGFMVLSPYVFGVTHLMYHEMKMREGDRNPFSVVLVQTAFPAEEAYQFHSTKQMVDFVLEEWKQILFILKKQVNKTVDLVVLPEATVPFGTYSFVYSLDAVKHLFEESLEDPRFPPLELPWAVNQDGQWLVSNAFFSKTIANTFNSGLVIGLEDAENIYDDNNQVINTQYYSAAQYFQPHADRVERYEKRVLVPMGEYIPFESCRELCASYGIHGSLTCGQCAKVMRRHSTPFGVTICYEETFGDMMRENRVEGAEILVNVTSDVWYPNSRLPQQHFDHSKLRTVENGIPLARACNTGVTGVVDSLGRDVAILGKGDKNQEWISDSLYVNVPMYTYQTFYSYLGDGMIIGFCLINLLLFFISPRRK